MDQDMHVESSIREKLVLQRDRARSERDEYLSIIRKLAVVNDGPRSIHYNRAWMSALETARAAIRDDCPLAQENHARTTAGGRKDTGDAATASPGV
jgi:hypothetical protein